MKTTEKIKILYVHHGTGIGGAPISLRNLIIELDPDQFDIMVLFIKKSCAIDFFISSGINCELVDSFFYNKVYKGFSNCESGFIRWHRPFTLFKRKIIWLLSKYYFAPKVLSRYCFDILHLNSSTLIDWLYAGRKYAKTIIHIREPFSRGYIGIRKAWLVSEIDKYADHIIAISKDNADRIGLLEKTSIVYNFDKLSKPPCNKDLFPPYKILYLGGSATIKGFYVLVDSLRYLDDDIIVLFCGSYPNIKNKKMLKKFTPNTFKQRKALRTIKESPHAKMIGFVSDTSELLRDCIVGISPFVVEHFSRPVIECFMNRRPAIGSDVKGMDEIIIHGENGLLFENKNPFQLAQAINEMCEKPDMARQMGENGYELAIKMFSPKNARMVSKIYTKIVAGNGKK